MFVSVISFGLAMNPKAYDKLPNDLKPLVDAMGTKEAGVAMATYAWGGDPPPFTKYMSGLKLNRVALPAAADKEMRALGEKIMGQRIAALEKKGLPARKVYDELKALSAKYSAM